MLCVIGAGKFGSALYEGFKDQIKTQLCSATKKAGFTPLEQGLKSEYLLFALSTQHTRSWLEKNYKFSDKHKILIASKGIEVKNGSFLDEIYSSFIPKERLCFLSGPSFAKEYLAKLPCALVISGLDTTLCEEFSSFFPKSFVKTYISSDIKGTQIAGAYKNVLAIAAGVCDALKYGENARASLMARGLIEMYRFARAYGANDRTFLGLSGAGDLFLSASSKLSRNYRTGLALGENKSLKNILEELGEVAEGVQSSKAIVKIAKAKNIYVPIASEVAKVIAGKDVKESVQSLLAKKGPKTLCF